LTVDKVADRIESVLGLHFLCHSAPPDWFAKDDQRFWNYLVNAQYDTKGVSAAVVEAVKRFVLDYGIPHCYGKTSILEIMCIKASWLYVEYNGQLQEPLKNDVEVFSKNGDAPSWDSTRIDLNAMSKMAECLYTQKQQKEYKARDGARPHLFPYAHRMRAPAMRPLAVTSHTGPELQALPAGQQAAGGHPSLDNGPPHEPPDQAWQSDQFQGVSSDYDQSQWQQHHGGWNTSNGRWKYWSCCERDNAGQEESADEGWGCWYPKS